MKLNKSVSIDQKILEIKFFLLPFVVFIFSLIIFENLYIFIAFLFVFCMFFIYFSFKYKNISFLSLLFFTASLSLGSYLYFIYHSFENISGYNTQFVSKKFVITDTLVNNRYVWKDEFDNSFVLKNLAKNYRIWDKIKIYWMMYPLKLFYKNYNDFINNRFLSTNFDYTNLRFIFHFNYTKYLMMKNISWIVYSKKEFETWKEKLDIFGQLRQDVVKRTDYVYSWYDDKYKALSLGLLIGDKSYLSKKLYDEFIHSGLVHIIVVSGWNIMFLVIFLSVVLFFIPFYIRLILIIFAILSYAFMVWGDSSVIRATIMGLLSLIALFFWKVTDVRRILAIAFIIMLVYNPYFLIYDLWFILSFLAIIWILVFNKFILDIDKEDKIMSKLKYFYNNYVLPTLWASLFTAPAILFWTKQVNLLAFVASIFVVPMVPLLMLNSFIILFLPDFAVHFFLSLNIYMMDYIFFFSKVFSDSFAWMIHL